ncbi:VOC family protein [Falsiroseomonas sp. HW251]|uniref:VOC family protein n=1 Tax=Falsiroseomonas sp. HW251 TaxID=3390998 RepID=UPI003D312C04
MKPRSAIAQLRTTDLARTIRFYTEILGLELVFQYEDFYAGLRAGGQMIHLKLVDAPDPSIAYVAAGDHLHLYLETDDAAALAAAVEARGGSLAKPVHDTPWGTREFVLRDDQGHTIHCGQQV